MFQATFYKLWSADQAIHIKDICRKSSRAFWNYTLTLHIMFNINRLCFMSNFSFKVDTLYRIIPSGDRLSLFIPPDSLMGDTISPDTGTGTYSWWAGNNHLALFPTIVLEFRRFQPLAVGQICSGLSGSGDVHFIELTNVKLRAIYCKLQIFQV